MPVHVRGGSRLRFTFARPSNHINAPATKTTEAPALKWMATLGQSLYHGSTYFLACLVCSKSSLVFFYIRLRGTGKNILEKSLVGWPERTFVARAVVRVFEICFPLEEDRLATAVAQHGCSQYYARKCCTTYRCTTPHAAAECVQRAGCRKDGSVNIILGQRAGWRGDALVHTISALGKDGFLVGVYVIFLFPEESFATRRELCDDIDRFYDGTATAESHECHSPRMSPVSL